MRSLSNAICTSGDPVSRGCVLYCSITPILSSFTHPSPEATCPALRLSLLRLYEPSTRFFHSQQENSSTRGLRQGLPSALQRSRVVSQQRLADNLYRRAPLLQKIVVEFLQRKRGAFLLLQVRPQLQNFQLTQRVIQVGWVRRSPLRLHCSGRLRLVAFLHKEIHGLLERHLVPMHFNSNDKSCVPQQCVLQLAQPD